MLYKIDIDEFIFNYKLDIYFEYLDISHKK